MCRISRSGGNGRNIGTENELRVSGGQFVSDQLDQGQRHATLVRDRVQTNRVEGRARRRPSHTSQNRLVNEMAALNYAAVQRN